MSVKSLYVVLLLFVMTALSPKASAAGLTELGLLARCYAHLTGHPLPIQHPLRSQVTSGTLTAQVACNSLLDKATLSANSGSLLSVGDMEARSILQNFNNFHRSWFPGNIVEGIQEYSAENSIGTMDIYDTTEPALAITRAVFSEDGRYADVLTSPNGLHAIREQNEAIRALIGWSVMAPGRRIYGNNTDFDQNLFHFSAPGSITFSINSDDGTSIFAFLPKIEVGELIGIRKNTDFAAIPNVSLYPLGAYVPGSSVPALNFNFNLFQTFGGGVLGTPIYFMLNYGHGRGLMANGTTKVPRRWSQTNMTTFLCANLPALRESDITSFNVGTSSAPFRNGNSCLRCHANLDQMAYTARNLMTVGTDFFEFTLGSRKYAKNAMVLTSFATDAGATGGWPSEPVPNFHRMAPTGKLYFRSFSNGDLIDKPVNNISELGSAMTQTEDYYQCAAKRYFAYFTGIQVSLYDRRDPANALLNKTATENDVKDREYIENLAAELKQTQSIRTMIKRILSSDYYKSEDYRP